jgi:hypothetical protein
MAVRWGRVSGNRSDGRHPAGKRQRVLVSVTQEDIERAHANSARKGAVARAINRVLRPGWTSEADEEYICFLFNGEWTNEDAWWAKTPEGVSRVITDLNQYEEVVPFQFWLSVPNEAALFTRMEGRAR